MSESILVTSVADAMARLHCNQETYGKFLKKAVTARTISAYEAEVGIMQNLKEITDGIPQGFKNIAVPYKCTTLEGNYDIAGGDYLILGANGEVYPTPKAVFEATRNANTTYFYNNWATFKSTEVVEAILVLEPFSVIASNHKELFSKSVPYWLIEGPISGLRPCHLPGFEIYNRI